MRMWLAVLAIGTGAEDAWAWGASPLMPAGQRVEVIPVLPPRRR